MTKEQEDRLRLLARSSVVGGDIRAALEAIDSLRASAFCSNAIREVPEECTLVAVHTGDAWHLTVEDRSGEGVAFLEWPKSWPETVNGDQLKAFGFEVV